MSIFFFFNDTATTEIYTLSLHDALPILPGEGQVLRLPDHPGARGDGDGRAHPADRAGLRGRRGRDGDALPALPPLPDRKSTRLNSSHANISYAVFCLKKTKNSSTVHLFY